MRKVERNQQPARVPSKDASPQEAKQAGESRDRWWWVQTLAWTRRMLTALDEGVKGGRWFSLMDKVFDRHHLLSAFQKVAGNKGAAGVDHVTIEMYEADLATNISTLSTALCDDRYRPQLIRRVHIPKPGSKETRPLGIPTVRDRVVQTALRNVLEPIFERDFAEQSYGFRPGRGCKDALRRVDSLLKEGYRYIVDADLKSYFDTISHSKLLELVKTKVADGRVLRLLESFLQQGIMEDLKEWTPEEGCPQGAVMSPLLSNVYLDPLDHLMAERGYQMIRYADDFVILCRSLDEAQAALALVREWTATAELTLHPSKTKIVHTAKAGFDFLGYRFRAGIKRPRSKSKMKLKDAVRAKTRRCHGQCLPHIIATLNPTLRGWFEYFKHSHKSTFPILDRWVRGRLRSILRKRSGGRGRGKGLDHRRWPNRFFERYGLYSMTEARTRLRQSASAVTH